MFASDFNEPPLGPDGWVVWQDRNIGKLTAGTHSITVRVHGVPGTSFYDTSEYTRFVTVEAKEDGGFNGNWSGTTSQERPLSFEGEDGHVTLVMLDVRVAGTICTPTVSGGVKKIPGALIMNSSFTWSNTDPMGNSITLSGTFDSWTTARRTLELTSQTCNGTTQTDWSTTKD